MKPNFLKSALFLFSLLSTVSSASAETVHAKIPFEFLANGKSLPAGTYTVRPLSGTTSALVFVNEATGEMAVAFARTTHDLGATSPGALTIRTAERTYELSMRPNGSTAPIVLTLTK